MSKREPREATADEFRDAWRKVDPDLDVNEINDWIETVRRGGYMTFPDGARLVLMEAKS